MLEESVEEDEAAAVGLRVRIRKFKFVASCIVLKKCFSLSKTVSEYLQQENMDLVSAVSGVQSLTETLSTFRNEERMDMFLEEARKYCTEKELEVNDFDQQEETRTKRRCTIPTFLCNWRTSTWR